MKSTVRRFIIYNYPKAQRALGYFNMRTSLWSSDQGIRSHNSLRSLLNALDLPYGRRFIIYNYPKALWALGYFNM